MPTEMLVKQGGRIRDQIESHTTGEMCVMSERGDVRVTWNARDNDEVTAARSQFDDLRGKGFRAFAVEEGGSKGEQINEFDANAQKIIMAPPMAGGSEVADPDEGSRREGRDDLARQEQDDEGGSGGSVEEESEESEESEEESEESEESEGESGQPEQPEPSEPGTPEDANPAEGAHGTKDMPERDEAAEAGDH